MGFSRLANYYSSGNSVLALCILIAKPVQIVTPHLKIAPFSLVAPAYSRKTLELVNRHEFLSCGTLRVHDVLA